LELMLTAMRSEVARRSIALTDSIESTGSVVRAPATTRPPTMAGGEAARPRSPAAPHALDSTLIATPLTAK
jgi:hypothetical protein